jgi:hypothetical protein
LVDRLNETSTPEGVPTRPAIKDARTSATNKKAAMRFFCLLLRFGRPSPIALLNAMAKLMPGIAPSSRKVRPTLAAAVTANDNQASLLTSGSDPTACCNKTPQTLHHPWHIWHPLIKDCLSRDKPSFVAALGESG